MNTKARSYKAFYLLMREMPHADKAELVRSFTGGRTESLREMTDREYHKMLRDLQREVRDERRLRMARSVVLRLLQLWGVDTSDWTRVNQFTEQRRIAGKPFRYLSIGELERLSLKLRAMLSRGQASPPKTPPTHVERALPPYTIGEA